MQNGFNAYAAAAKNAQAVVSPRELEASLLIKAAMRLQAVADDWNRRERELDDVVAVRTRRELEAAGPYPPYVGELIDAFAAGRFD